MDSISCSIEAKKSNLSQEGFMFQQKDLFSLAAPPLSSLLTVDTRLCQPRLTSFCCIPG